MDDEGYKPTRDYAIRTLQTILSMIDEVEDPEELTVLEQNIRARVEKTLNPPTH